jgi:hypothetical protein
VNTTAGFCIAQKCLRNISVKPNARRQTGTGEFGSAEFSSVRRHAIACNSQRLQFAVLDMIDGQSYLGCNSIELSGTENFVPNRVQFSCKLLHVDQLTVRFGSVQFVDIHWALDYTRTCASGIIHAAAEGFGV